MSLADCKRVADACRGLVDIDRRAALLFAKEIAARLQNVSTPESSEDTGEQEQPTSEKQLPEALARGLERTQGLPLRLSSMEEEIDLLAVLALLNIGSGFRRELHARPRGGRGAADTMRFGVLGMALGGGVAGALRADALAEADVFTIGQNFQLPITEEYEVMPGVRRDRESPLRPLVDSIQWCLADTGRVLRSRMVRGVGQFVLDTVDRRPRNACFLVAELAKAFPAFDDSYADPFAPADAPQRTVRLHKKAQLLCADLYRAFRNQDERFDFTDIAELTVMSDNVLPAVLRRAGVLVLEDSLRRRIEDGRLLRSGSREEIALRACSVVACDVIATELSTLLGCTVLPMVLDYYLWSLGKEEEYRSVERHATQDTRMY